MDPFKRLLITMSVRPDQVVVFVRQFVIETLGDAFVQQEPLDIGKAFAETSAATPLIFILGEEVDPCKYIFRLACQLILSCYLGI
jgi:dynein heavy chain